MMNIALDTQHISRASCQIEEMEQIIFISPQSPVFYNLSPNFS